MKRVTLFFLILIAHSASGLNINIKTFHAVGDGMTDNTQIIQKAIDKCSKAGGGTITIPEGTFLTGPVFLKSNININLEQGSILLGVANMDVYQKAFPNFKGKETTPALIYAKDVVNIGLSGTGTIDGQGYNQSFQLGNDAAGGPFRPKLIYFRNCKNVNVKDVTLRNPAYWTQHYEGCDGVVIRGIKVYAHCNWNNDGLDIDSKNVVVSDCIIDSDDDAICFKSDFITPCQNITVSNCVLSTNCNAIKFGTGSKGGFKNITVNNIEIHGPMQRIIWDWSKAYPWMGIESNLSVIAGIAVECVDGGITDGINISNIVMSDVQTPIFIRLGDRKQTFTKQVSTLKNITITNVIAKSNSKMTCSITGMPDKAVENIFISNVNMEVRGGGISTDNSLDINEAKEKYPENRMFGVILPAYGFYVRHANQVSFKDLTITTREVDARSTFVLDDVHKHSIEGCTANGIAPTIVTNRLIVNSN